MDWRPYRTLSGSQIDEAAARVCDRLGMEEPDGCAFCRWLAAPSRTRVYEDGDVFVEVDPRQPHRGHCLVMPVRHIENIFELDHDAAAVVMAATVRVARAVKSAFQPDGLSLWQSNGPGAHQEVPHFHMHVMPRWWDDELLQIYPRHVDTPDIALRESMANDIRAYLA